MLFKYAPQKSLGAFCNRQRRLNIVLRHTAKHDTTALKNSVIFFLLLMKGLITRLKPCCGKPVTFTPIFYQLSTKINRTVAFFRSQLSMYCNTVTVSLKN